MMLTVHVRYQSESGWICILSHSLPMDRTVQLERKQQCDFHFPSSNARARGEHTSTTAAACHAITRLSWEHISCSLHSMSKPRILLTPKERTLGSFSAELLSSTQPVLVHAVIPPQVHSSTLALVKPHQLSPCPTLQPVQVLLSSITASRCILPSKEEMEKDGQPHKQTLGMQGVSRWNLGMSSSCSVI